MEITLGKRINKLRMENGYSQKDLADMVGVTAAAMSRYLNDEREPNVETLSNLATALNTTSDYLIRGVENKDSFEEIYRLVARSSKTLTLEEKMKLVSALSNNGR